MRLARQVQKERVAGGREANGGDMEKPLWILKALGYRSDRPIVTDEVPSIGEDEATLIEEDVRREADGEPAATEPGAPRKFRYQPR